jgi:SAM-dependent methyltransferase
MAMERRVKVLGIGAAALLVVAVTWRADRALQRAAVSMRSFSLPSARLYALLGRLIRPLYARFAADAAALLEGVPAPRVLEIGPGPGEVAMRLARALPAVELTGLDVDPSMVKVASARAAREGVADRVLFMTGDVAAMPFDDGRFDLVLSSFSVHHWPDGAQGFAEIRRVLRPGGRALLFDVPDSWGHAETGSDGLAALAQAGGFPHPEVTTVRWPLALPTVRRLLAVRD